MWKLWKLTHNGILLLFLSHQSQTHIWTLTLDSFGWIVGVINSTPLNFTASWGLTIHPKQVCLYFLLFLTFPLSPCCVAVHVEWIGLPFICIKRQKITEKITKWVLDMGLYSDSIALESTFHHFIWWLRALLSNKVSPKEIHLATNKQQKSISSTSTQLQQQNNGRALGCDERAGNSGLNHWKRETENQQNK